MRKTIYELNSVIRVLFIITVICGLIWKFSSNEMISYITGTLSTITFICGFVLNILKDEVKDHLLQKEGWV